MSIWLRMPPQRMDFRVERRRRAHGGIGGERAGHERRPQAAMRPEEAGQSQGRRDLRAVDEREPLLGGEGERFEAGAGEGVAGGQADAPEQGLALADHHRGHMGDVGARSPEAPTEPWPGMTGSRSRTSIA